MDTSTNSLNWFEIPVTDLARARHFYQVAFSIHMPEMEMMGMKMAIFPQENNTEMVSGALVQSEQHQPADIGSVIYLNADPDILPVLERIAALGGQVLLAKTLISPESGYMALFIDSEGNKVGLHSRQ